MICKLLLSKFRATVSNFLNVIENGIFYHSAKFISVRSKVFEIQASEFWRFSFIQNGKWAGGRKLSSNMAATI